MMRLDFGNYPRNPVDCIGVVGGLGGTSRSRTTPPPHLVTPDGPLNLTKTAGLTARLTEPQGVDLSCRPTSRILTDLPDHYPHNPYAIQ